MTHPRDHIGGYQHRRDHRDRLEPHVRDVTGGRRSDLKHDDAGDRPWAGDDVNWCWWDADEPSRAIGGWSFAWPAIMQDEGLYPMRDDWTADERFVPLQQDGPPSGGARDETPAGGFYAPQQVAPGTWGVMMAATEELEQRNIFIPAGPTSLFAHHRTPPAPPVLSTRVYDNRAGQDELNAGLHTAWWVRPLNDANTQLALNLTKSAGDDTGWGYFISVGDASDPNPNQTIVAAQVAELVLARLSWEVGDGAHGGPIHPGHSTNDKHRDGTSPEGLAKQPGHLWIHAKHYKNKVEDGEKEHTEFQKGVDFPVVTKAYQGYDHATELHRRWTTSPLFPPPLIPWEKPKDGIRVTREEPDADPQIKPVIHDGSAFKKPQDNGGSDGADGQMVNKQGSDPKVQPAPVTAPKAGESTDPEKIVIGAMRSEKEVSFASLHITGARDKNTQDYDDRYGGHPDGADTAGPLVDEDGNPVSFPEPHIIGGAGQDTIDGETIPGQSGDIGVDWFLPLDFDPTLPDRPRDRQAEADEARRKRKEREEAKQYPVGGDRPGALSDAQREENRKRRQAERDRLNAGDHQGFEGETFEPTGYDKLGLGNSSDSKFEGIPPENLNARTVQARHTERGRVRGRMGRLSAAAEKRGGPFPYSLHVGAVLKVSENGENQYKSEPGVFWDNGTAEQACAFFYPGGWLPDGPDDQSAWVGALDYAFLPSGRLGLGDPDTSSSTGRFTDGPYLTTTGASGSRDLLVAHLDASGSYRRGTVHIGSDPTAPADLHVWGCAEVEEAVVLTEQGSVPKVLSAGELMLWATSETPNDLMMTRDTNEHFYVSPPVRIDYSFSSPSGGSGTYYAGGYYYASAADANLTQASTTVTWGTANIAYGAHAFAVTAAAGSTDAPTSVVGVRVTGTKIEDDGTRTPGYTENLIPDITAASTDAYYESASKWIGQVTYELYIVSGSPTTYSVDFNYGFAAHEDFGGHLLDVHDFIVDGLAGANDSGFNVELLHHQATGWTYHATAFVPGSSAIASLQTDYNTEYQLAANHPFKYERTNLDYEVDATAAGKEGTIVRITTTSNGAVETCSIHIAARFKKA